MKPADHIKPVSSLFFHFVPSEGILQTGASSQPADWGHTGRRSVMPIVWLGTCIQNHFCDLWGISDVISWQDQLLNTGEWRWPQGSFRTHPPQPSPAVCESLLSWIFMMLTPSIKLFYLELRKAVSFYSTWSWINILNYYLLIFFSSLIKSFFVCAFSSRRQWEVLGSGALQEFGGPNGCILYNQILISNTMS